MDPLSFLKVTARKLKTGKHEADWRSSASRSYYAIYHYLTQSLENEGVCFGKSRDHGLIPQCLGQEVCSEEIKLVGVHFTTVQQDRVSADYNFKRKFIKNKAMKAHDLALVVIKDFDDLISDAHKQKIIVDCFKRILTSKGFSQS